MKLIENLKPKFWDHVYTSIGIQKDLFNLRSIWKFTVLLTLAVTIIPLVVMAFIDYRVSRKSTEAELLLRTSRLVSNTRRTVSYFLEERKAALDFVIQNDPYRSLIDPERLGAVLEHLKAGFGGFVDLGVINDKGTQITYSGPYRLTGKNYKDSDWFEKVSKSGIYISDVFMGYRNIPHMVIAVKHNLPKKNFYVLRATLDTARFNQLLSSLEIGGGGDAFVINQKGVLQTPSRNHGQVLASIDLPIPPYSERSQVQEINTALNKRLILGYAYIPDTPFVLIIVKPKDRLMAPWYQGRLQIIGFLLASAFTIILVILGGITYLVNQIYMADKRRLAAMHKIEYGNKMASLGRLSAGLAHEINNPLAIINEKAGLIKDLFAYRKDYATDPKLLQLIDSIISSVNRCADITHRLLNFARHSDASFTPIDLQKVIFEVLGFIGKETEYRSITVNVEVKPDVPLFNSDLGRLQEIFLNLITNALAAMEDGGELDISAHKKNEWLVDINFSDDGHGIPKSDLERVFEPFFSTKTGKGGTGLGLSITYGLVQEIGGRISVESTEGEGTTFTITLPLDRPEVREDKNGMGSSKLPEKKIIGGKNENPAG